MYKFKLVFSVFNLVFLILVFTVYRNLSAQNSKITFERITTDHGLSSNRISGIVQDKTGFLWLATNNGLNRFDGIEIKQYIKQQDDTTSLSNNSILALYCDRDDELWILTFNYLHRYNKKTDNFDRFVLSDKKVSYRIENKGMISEDTSGNIWVGTPYTGLFCYNKSTNIFIRVLHEITTVSSVFCDQTGKLWIGGENGLLIKYDPVSKSYKKFLHSIVSERIIQDNFIWKIWQTNPGHINLLLFNGFYQFDFITEKFSEIAAWNKKINYTVNEFRTVYQDNQTLWTGTQGGGLFKIDLEKGSSDHFQTISNSLNSLSNNSVTAILKDRSGVYWVATKDGLNKYDPTMELFEHFQHNPENPNSLQYNFVSSFCESPDGTICVGTFGKGITFFNRRNENFQPLRHSNENSGSLINEVVRALEPDREGNIWIGTIKGLSCYNLKNKSFTNYRSTPGKGGLVSGNIMSLLLAGNNQLYIGTLSDGVMVCDPSRLPKEGFRKFNNEIPSFNNSNVRKMIELHNGTIVFGTLGNGLFFVKDKKVLNVSPSELSKSVDSEYVNALSEDKDKNIWVGTWDGLFLLDSTYVIRKQFYTMNGLPSNEITGILTDNNNNIWVSGMNGLSQLTKNDGFDYKITNYSAHNGLQGSYFTAYATLKTSDGELYFGGYNGFNRFYPERIHSIHELPEVKFTDFQVFNQSVPINKKIEGRILLTQNISDTKTITLNFKHRVIGFRFAAMTTSQVEKVKYACQMKGIDPDWVYMDYNRRSISYNNLPPGEYTLTVKACNADGIWNTKSTSITIKVLPPFWKSWWAYILYTLFIAGLLYLAREYSLSRTRLENKALLERVHREKDAEINNLKIKFFINISHEIRTPLSLIIAPLEKLLYSATISQEIKKHLEIIYSNAQRLLTLINQLLDFRKIESGNVHLYVAPYNMINFIHEIKKAFDDNAAHKNIEFLVFPGTDSLQAWFDPDSMEKIMFNLLSNALKFTRPGGSIKIFVNHLSQEGKFEILIRDSGIGIAAENLEKIFDLFYQAENRSFLKQDSMGTGIGLSIVKNLVELHKGEISVSSTTDEFTQFRMVFKTGKKHLENNNNITISENPLPFSLNFHALAANMEESDGLETSESTNCRKSKKEIKILIVEDNPEIRYYLKQSLQDNYDTLEASDGKIGCEMALQFIPDLIITDIMMPERNGIELCQILKNEMLTQHIPIIILSAKSSLEDTLEGLESGADDYVAKPFNEQILRAKIKSLLVNRQKLIEKYRHPVSGQNNDNEPYVLLFDDPLVKRISEFVCDNLSDEELTSEKIEEHFKISKMQLYRKLKATTGWSVNSLIREIRIRKAKKLLRNSEMNISEIAYNLGFSDPLYFSKYFKKEVGKAPLQYKKEN
jgi:signal transduction histidine kinase/ligand-binding sensor domain-containing protein/DNA-binding response OmpR family regulator